MLEALMKFSPGIVLCLGGIGSCFGILAAATAAAGAWASEGKGGKKLSFQYIIMVAMPISQTLYAMILMNAMFSKLTQTANMGLLLGVGAGCGLVELFSAAFQGRAGASGVRCLNENGGKGFGLIIIALGIIETVGIFAMVFGLMILKAAV